MTFPFVIRIRKSFQGRSMASLVVGLLSLILVAGPAMALTVEEYCTLSRDLMALSVQEWQEKARVASENQEATKEELVNALRVVEQTYRAQQEQLYANYLTTYDDYMRFMGTNSRVVNGYLEKHPLLLNEIGDLSGQVDSYAQQVEAVMETK